MRRAWRWLVVGAMLASAGFCDEAEDKACQAAWPALQKLLKDGQFEAVQKGVESYLRQYPNDSYWQRRIVGVMGSVLGNSQIWGSPKYRPLAEGILAKFADVPNYYTFAAAQLAHSYLFWPDKEQNDNAKAEEITGKALEVLGDDLSPELIYTQLLFTRRLIALYNLKRYDDALAFAKSAAVRCPLVMQDRYYLNWTFQSAKRSKDPATTLPAAKLYFCLCEYDEKWINEAIALVGPPLGELEGPGVALQFAKSQQTPGMPNALQKLPILNLGLPREMMKSAGDDVQAQMNVHLYARDVQTALDLAKRQMKESAGTPVLLAAALKNNARCFKAHDCSVARANLFLQFHATGEGENPLPALETELKQGRRAGP